MRPEMPKQAIALSELVKQFETHCRLEGKPETTCRWYRDMLRRFLGWAGELSVEEFTIERVREYLAYAKDRPRYDGHPTTPSNGRTVSPCTFRHQAVTLRVFSRWLRDEGYTTEHRLERLRTPQIPEKVVEVLTPDEIRKLLASEPTNTPHGSRNRALLVLALDTGLRMSELITLERRRVNPEGGVLTAIGKGSKERVVPFGYTAARALSPYILHFRPAPALPQFDNLFLQENGWPLTRAAMQMLAKRIAARTGIGRFHWHLLRHTFAVNYLINSGAGVAAKIHPSSSADAGAIGKRHGSVESAQVDLLTVDQRKELTCRAVVELTYRLCGGTSIGIGVRRDGHRISVAR